MSQLHSNVFSGARAENVAAKCAEGMVELLESNSCVDNNNQDQVCGVLMSSAFDISHLILID